MALEQITFNIASFNDADAAGNNYYAGVVYEVFNINDTLTDIFSDSAGSNPIAQDGISNVSDSTGKALFYIDKGAYYALSGGERRDFETSVSALDLRDENTKYNPPTIQAAIDSTEWDANGGEVLEAQEYYSGTGGGGKWKTIIAGTTDYTDKPNGTWILACVGVPNLALIKTKEDSISLRSLGVTVLSSGAITDILENSKTIIADNAASVPNSMTIPDGATIEFTGDGVWELGTSAFIAWNGQIKAPRKEIFTYIGSQSTNRILGTPKTSEWLCDWFGVIADGATDWRADGKAYMLFSFSSSTKAKVVFTTGFYKTPLDNTQSNVTIRCEPDVIFAGTVHAAINNAGATNPELNPTNVRWEGILRSLERVGTYYCDGVWIDEIYIKDDEPNSFSGYSAGVHFYQGTKNLSCPKITVENSKSSFGFGLDSGIGEPLPEGCWFGHIEIISSGVTGFYSRSKNCEIGSVNIRNYGQNELVDVNNIGLPGFTGDTSKTYGYAVDGCENLKVGSVTVAGSGYSTIAGSGVDFGAGTTTHSLVQSRSANTTGFNLRAGQHTVSSIDTRLAGEHGVNIASSVELDFDKIITSYNTNKGIVASNARLVGGSIKSEFNTDEGVLFSGTDCGINYLESYNNSGGLNNVQLTSPHGFIGKIKTWRSVVNTGGGLYITGTSDGFEYSYESIKEGDASLYAFFASNTDDMTCTSMKVTESTNQAFRVVSVSDSSFNGVKIPDVTSGSSVIGATLANVSFMNCNNDSGVASNIGSASVSEFNSVGMTI